MSDKVSDLLKEALSLPAEARAALATSLLSSLDGAVDESVELEWEEEIARRVKELDAGVVATVPWAEVRKRLLAKIADARH
ncbi:MAG: addiction module protein [Candidatus Korobacteraceae bacterium]